MKPIEMKEFGVILTGREYGVNVANKIFSTKKEPYVLDFSGVVSMGSSFGDEIFKKLQFTNGNSIEVRNANKVVQQALLQVASDLKLNLNFVE